MERFWPIAWRAAVSLWLSCALAYNLYSEGFKFPFSVVFFAFVYAALVAIWLKELKLKLSTQSLSLLFLSFLVAIFGSGTALAVAQTYPRNCTNSYGKAHAACSVENLAYGIGGHICAVALYAIPTAICSGLLFFMLAKRRLKP